MKSMIYYTTCFQYIKNIQLKLIVHEEKYLTFAQQIILIFLCFLLRFSSLGKVSQLQNNQCEIPIVYLSIIDQMSEIIDNYEEDLVENIKQATTKIEGKFESKQDWKDMRALLTQCEKGIKLIQTELVGQPGPLRASKTARLRQHKRKFDLLKRQTFNEENNWELEAGKNLLMGNRTTSTQVINNYDKSTEAAERLRQSVKVMYENLEISQNVGSQLTNQTSKLIGSKKKVQDIRHDLGRSERKIKSIMLRMKRNKFILGGVILFIVVVLIIVLTSYFK